MARQKKDEEYILTEKQELFVDAFLGDEMFNPIGAYKAAGYAESMKPYAEAMKILSSKAVINAIHKRMADMKNAFWINEDVVIRKLWEEATNSEAPGSSHAARINALVWIGKHLGMWQDKVEEKDTKPTIIIQQYGSEQEQMKKKIEETPEVEESKDNVKLPEGIILTNYDTGTIQ